MRSYDAIVVGSGPTGGVAARALSAAGMSVLVLEAGRSRTRGCLLDLHDQLWRKIGYRIEEDPAAVRRQPIQSACYAWPRNPHAFVTDVDAAYLTEPDQPFAWIRSRQIGGRMLVQGHGLQFYRFSDLEFKAGERDGASASWPISYADLAPYYDGLERWMRVRGTRDGLGHLPDCVLASESGLNAAELRLKQSIEQRWRDRRVIAGRTAAPPMPIKDALATGRCHLRTDAVVRAITLQPGAPLAAGVSYVDARTGRTRDAAASVVVLCASAIESARLLLASATRDQPDGLANSSGLVGRYLMDHTHLTGIHGTMPLTQPVPSASWAYIPRFQNICASREAFVRGYGVQVFTMWRECAFTAFGEMLPHPDNRVTIERNACDRWGVPLARIACVHRDNERAMLPHEIEACVEMLEAAGVEITGVKTDLSTPGLASHEMGTARMGNDPRTSVLNQFCQSWDIRNLFVMDGSCFVTQGAQNPTLTMMAIAARSCDYIIESRRRGDL